MAEEVVWTVAFADGPGGGNPCPVVFGADDWSPAQRQARAAEFGVETAFVLAPSAGGDARYRYYVPRHEMEMCVHATVAATVVLGRSGRLARTPAIIETPLGLLEVEWDADAGTATVAQFPPHFGPPVTGIGKARVLDVLRIAADQLDDDTGPIQSVSTARPKLLVPLRDEAVLDALVPDFDLVGPLCDELGVTGFYPFTRRAAGADAAARQFPAGAGYDEDPATGVAAAALGAYLSVGGAATGWQRVRIAQGRAMGRPSLMHAEALVDSAGAVVATRVGGVMQPTEPTPLVTLARRPSDEQDDDQRADGDHGQDDR